MARAMPQMMIDEIEDSESQRRGSRADEEGTAGKNPCGVASIPPQRSYPAGGFHSLWLFFFVVILNEVKDLHFCPPPIVSREGRAPSVCYDVASRSPGAQ